MESATTPSWSASATLSVPATEIAALTSMISARVSQAHLKEVMIKIITPQYTYSLIPFNEATKSKREKKSKSLLRKGP